jgi:hypothetical protein
MWIKIAATAIAIVVAGYIISLFWMPTDVWGVLRHAHHLLLAGKIAIMAGKLVLFMGVALITGGVWLWQKWSQRQSAA